MTEERATRRLIVGLGNPGPAYSGTRHNVGFDIIDRLLTKYSADVVEREVVAQSALFGVAADDRSRIAPRTVLWVLKPGTYMNRSGGPTSIVVERFGFAPEQVLVVHDDLDLELGRLRLRPKGSSGGHHGVQDIIERLGVTGFHRLRVGIGRSDTGEERDEVIDFVLDRFGEDERELLDGVIERAVSACQVWQRDGIIKAMDGFNRSPSTDEGQPRLPDSTVRDDTRGGS